MTRTLINLRVLKLSSTVTLVLAHLGLLAGECWFSTHTLYCYTHTPVSLAGPVSIGASSLAVESTLGGVPEPFACDFFRFGLSFSSCLVSLHLSLIHI